MAAVMIQMMIARTTRPTTVNTPATAPVLWKKPADLMSFWAVGVGAGVGPVWTTVMTVIV